MLNFGLFDWVESSATLAPAEVYAHKLDLAAAADAAGFHGMFIAEHHGTPLSIDGSPSVLLSAIFQRTRRLADRVENLRPEQHRRVARALPRDPRGVLQSLRQPGAQLRRKSIPLPG